MTAKRFTNHITKTDADGTIHTDGILDANEDNKIIITNYFYIASLLNELSDKNRQLEKENEQLKKRIKVLEDTIEGLTETIAHYDIGEDFE